MQSRAHESSWVERFQVAVGGIEEAIWAIRGLIEQVLDMWMSLEQDSRDFSLEDEARSRSQGGRMAASPRGGAPAR